MSGPSGRERKEKKAMKRIWENIKAVMKNFINAYKESMNMYGDAFLRGGSYGC